MNNLIRREDAIKALYKYSFVSKDVIEKEINAIPSADRPQGEWKGYNADKGGDWLRDDGTPVFLVCDKCYGTVINNGSAHWNFCPNCGARMKGADDE